MTKRDGPSILFIMGTARSGTTISEILLGNSPGNVGVGELTHIFRDGFLGDQVCSCGSKPSVCEVWRAVMDRCGWSPPEVEAAGRLIHRLDWHRGFPAMATRMVVPGVMQRYRAIHATLFEAIQEVTGTEVIVDSSQYAGRALALHRLFPGQVRVICLTRSPNGLMNAFQKPNKEEQRPKSVAGTFLYYAYVMLCCRIALFELRRDALCITFEQLMSNPMATLHRIEDWAGLDLTLVRNKIAAHDWFDVGHIVTGNRLRKAARVKFDPPLSHPHSFRVGTRCLVALMNAYRRSMSL